MQNKNIKGFDQMFNYKAIGVKSGVTIYLDTSKNAFRNAGSSLKYGTIVNTDLGEGRIIGYCRHGYLWFKLNKDHGFVSFWDNIKNEDDFYKLNFKIIRIPEGESVSNPTHSFRRVKKLFSFLASHLDDSNNSSISSTAIPKQPQDHSTTNVAAPVIAIRGGPLPHSDRPYQSNGYPCETQTMAGNKFHLNITPTTYTPSQATSFYLVSPTPTQYNQSPKISQNKNIDTQRFFSQPSINSQTVHSNQVAGDIPESFICPITGEIMKEPFFLSLDQKSYEKWAIEKHLLLKRDSPITRERMRDDQPIEEVLFPNRTLKDCIEEFEQMNKSLNKLAI